MFMRETLIRQTSKVCQQESIVHKYISVGQSDLGKDLLGTLCFISRYNRLGEEGVQAPVSTDNEFQTLLLR